MNENETIFENKKDQIRMIVLPSTPKPFVTLEAEGKIYYQGHTTAKMIGLAIQEFQLSICQK